MSETHRSGIRTAARLLAVGAAVALLAACGASTGSSADAPSATAAATPPASQAAATSSPRPTPAPPPTSIPRPTDLPTDGTCEEGHQCLGLLPPGAHRTELFEPGFGFTIGDGRWENLAMTPGAVDLTSIDAPGDVILFFVHPQAVKPDGSRDLSVELTAAGISDWMAGHQDLTVGPVTDVSIGGLKGKRMDVALASGAAATPGDCQVRTCLGLLKGQSNTWAWDWGVADSEMQRMYVLDGKDGPVLILVDSLDGTTFEALTKAADAILATVTFEQ